MIGRLARIALLLGLASGSAAAALNPDDFGWSLSLDVETLTAPGAPAGFRVLMPDAVYRGTASDTLRDVAVVDATGAVVPFTLFHPGTSKTVWRVLPVYAVADAPTTGTDPVTVTASSTTVTVRPARAVSAPTGQAADPPPGARVFIVDARQHRDTVRVMKLTWSPQTGNRTTRIRVDASDDMVHWRPAGEGVLARLDPGSGADADGDAATESVLRDEVVLTRNHTPGAWLRLVTIDPTPGEWRVTGVSVRAVEYLTEHSQTMTRLPDRASTFDTGGRFPVSALWLNWATPDALASATDATHGVRHRVIVYSRPTDTVAWQHRGTLAVNHGGRRAVGHAGSDGDAVRPLRMHNVADRFWKIEGWRDLPGTPSVTLQWRAHDLLFLARGEPPFALIYGNASLQHTAIWSRSRFTSEAGARPLAALPFAEPLGPPRELGGAERVRTPGISAQAIAVWAVLGLGTVLVLLMVRAVGRDPAAPPGDTGSVDADRD